MARSRLLKPDFFEDEKLAGMPFGARLFFESLWCQADREGRLEDRVDRLAAFAFPYDNRLQRQARKDCPAWMDALIKVGCVVRYEAGGQKLLWLPHFHEHQKVPQHEPKSLLPPLSNNVYQTVSNLTREIGSVANVPLSRSRSRSETEAEAEAEGRAPDFVPNLEPPWPDEPGFVGEYQRHYERLHGKTCPASHIADAAEIERIYGAEACIQVAKDLNWEKHPNYLRPKLEDRRNGIKPAQNRRAVGASTRGGPARDYSEFERIQAESNPYAGDTDEEA